MNEMRKEREVEKKIEEERKKVSSRVEEKPKKKI